MRLIHSEEGMSPLQRQIPKGSLLVPVFNSHHRPWLLHTLSPTKRRLRGLTSRINRRQGISWVAMATLTTMLQMLHFSSIIHFRPVRCCRNRIRDRLPLWVRLARQQLSQRSTVRERWVLTRSGSSRGRARHLGATVVTVHMKWSSHPPAHHRNSNIMRQPRLQDPIRIPSHLRM